MQAAFYTPYLDTLGGGEKYLFDIAKVLHLQGYTILFYWREPAIKDTIRTRFGNDYDFITIDTTWEHANALSRMQKSKQAELFFYHSDGSYFFSLAKKSYVILQAPTAEILPSKSLFARIKFRRFIPIYYDNFVKRFFIQHGISGTQYVLNPMVTTPPQTGIVPKERMILSVGRFFAHLHSKKQEVLIKAFNYAQQHHKEFLDYRLVLVGSYKEEDKKYLHYVEQCRNGNPNIILKTNCTFSELQRLYTNATFYWHAAGYGEDEKKHPEQMEHFGISIIESMAAGCIPIAFNGGGPKETILHDKNGYLYDKRIELINMTYRLIKNEKLRKQFSQKSVERALEKYSFKAFSQNVIRMIK